MSSSNLRLQAAKLRGCHTIIGVDRFATRLELAKTLGATSVIDTSNLDVDLAKKIQGLTDGAGSTITIDTTGNVALITSGVEFTSSRGQMIILGAPSIDAQLTVPIVPFMQVRMYNFIDLPSINISIDGENYTWEY